MKTLIFLLPLLSGCSTSKSFSIISPEDATPKSIVGKYPAFQVELNPRVQKEIDKTLQNKDSRKEFWDATRRMESYRAMIAPLLNERHLPLELLAIPLVQTGYLNRASSDVTDGMGIWRFTLDTANLYGLITADPANPKVSDRWDDRLNAQKETRAAIAYLVHLYGLFHDWRNVLTAYCVGEGIVSEMHERLPASTPWEVDQALSGPDACLSRTMATLYLWDHPAYLKPTM